MTSHDNVTDIDDAYIAAIWHSALNAYDHDGEGERDDDAAIADLGQSLATLRKQLENARSDALEEAAVCVEANKATGCVVNLNPAFAGIINRGFDDLVKRIRALKGPQ